ncbi:hypothetical protein H0H92_000833, partial [Tricholoma furcatifolium]
MGPKSPEVQEFVRSLMHKTRATEQEFWDTWSSSNSSSKRTGRRWKEPILTVLAFCKSG